MSSPPADRWLTAILSAAAAFALGQALQAANGTLVSESLNWLIGAVLLALAACVVVRPTRIERVGERFLLTFLAAAIAVQFIELFQARPGFYLSPKAVAFQFHAGLAVAALLVGIELRRNPRPGLVFFPLLLLTFIFLGRWIIQASPAPFIDVYVFQQQGIDALMHGHNPYALRYPNVYPDSAFYGEGLSKNGVLQFGYPYLPLSLLLALPGQIWFGDYRYAQLAAMAGAAALIAYARPGRIGPASAALLLFTPRSFFVLEQGWTDPFVVLGLAAVAFLAIRRPVLVPWIYGLTLALKQYTLFMVPAAWQLIPRPVSASNVWRFAIRAAAIGAVVTAPFVIWGPRDFWFDVVALQLLQPFRNDALTFLAAWAGSGGPPDPRLALLAFVAAAMAVAVGLWRQPRTAAGFAMTCALAYLAFFAFNKQAFANYYYFALGALCVVIGTVNPAARRE